MKKVVFDAIELGVASGFSEVSEAGIKELMPFVVVLDGNVDVMQKEGCWIEIIRVLLKDAWVRGGLKGKFSGFWNGLQLDFFQFEALKEAVRWVIEPLTVQPIESFEFEGVKYIFLKERFENVSAAEWTAGVMDFVELQKDEKVLDLLIANFCRPVRKDIEEFRASERWNGDEREVYNRTVALERATFFVLLPLSVKVLFLKWYQEQMRIFFEEYSELFGGGNSEKRYGDGRGFLMILKNAAKNHYLGDFEKVQNEDVNMVYSLLLDDYYDTLEIKRNG